MMLGKYSTEYILINNYYYNVLTDNPAEGATGNRGLAVGSPIRVPARGATGCHYAIGNDIIVSIHAPARGATLPQ